MDRVNAVLRHPRFSESLRRTAELEADRLFCRHGIDHLLAVSRIACILNLEAVCKVDNELLYAAGLLHDIGRWRQYEDDTPHEKESARIAAEILPDCGFSPAEINKILEAILSHRVKEDTNQSQVSTEADARILAEIIFRADKLSRCCFECVAYEQCRRIEKNTRLEY